MPIIDSAALWRAFSCATPTIRVMGVCGYSLPLGQLPARFQPEATSPVIMATTQWQQGAEITNKENEVRDRGVGGQFVLVISHLLERALACSFAYDDRSVRYTNVRKQTGRWNYVMDALI